MELEDWVREAQNMIGDNFWYYDISDRYIGKNCIYKGKVLEIKIYKREILIVIQDDGRGDQHVLFENVFLNKKLATEAYNQDIESMKI